MPKPAVLIPAEWFAMWCYWLNAKLTSVVLDWHYSSDHSLFCLFSSTRMDFSFLKNISIFGSKVDPCWYHSLPMGGGRGIVLLCHFRSVCAEKIKLFIFWLRQSPFGMCIIVDKMHKNQAHPRQPGWAAWLETFSKPGRPKPTSKGDRKQLGQKATPWSVLTHFNKACCPSFS